MPTITEYFAQAVAKMYVAKLCELPMKDIKNPNDPKQSTYPMREILDIFIKFMKTNLQSTDDGKEADHLLLSSAIIESTKPGISKFYQNEMFDACALLKIINKEEHDSETDKVFLPMLKATIIKMLKNPEENDDVTTNEDRASAYAKAVIKLITTYFDRKPEEPSVLPKSDDIVNALSESVKPESVKPESVKPKSVEPLPVEPKSVKQEPVKQEPETKSVKQEPDNTKMYSTLLDLAIDILSTTSDSANPSTDEILLDLSIDILSSIKTPTSKGTRIGGKLYGKVGGDPDEEDDDDTDDGSGDDTDEEDGSAPVGTLPIAVPVGNISTAVPVGNISTAVPEVNLPIAVPEVNLPIAVPDPQAIAEAELRDAAQRELAARQADIENALMDVAPPGARTLAGLNPFAFIDDAAGNTQQNILKEITESLGDKQDKDKISVHEELFNIITNALKYHIKGDDTGTPSKEGMQATLRIFEKYMNNHVADFIEGEHIALISLITIFKECEKMRGFLEDILNDNFVIFLKSPASVDNTQWSEFAEAMARNTISKLKTKLEKYIEGENPLTDLYEEMKKNGFSGAAIKQKITADKETAKELAADPPVPVAVLIQEGGNSNMYSTTKSLQKTLKTYSNSAFRNIRNIDSENDLHKNNVSKKHRRQWQFRSSVRA